MFKRFLCSLGQHSRTRPASHSTSSLPSSVQNLVYETVSSASTLTPTELVSRIECFANEGLRAPVRDLTSYLSSLSDPDLSAVSRALHASGRLQVYEPRLFEALVSHRGQVAISDLCLAVYECGRHGLRAKHFLLPLTEEISVRISDSVDALAVWRLWAGLGKFPREHRKLLLRTLPSMERATGNLSVRQLSVPMRVSKEMRGLREFRKLQVSISSLIARKIRLVLPLSVDSPPTSGNPTNLSSTNLGNQTIEEILSEIGIVMAASERCEETSEGVFEVVSRSMDLLAHAPSFHAVDTVSLVDILHTLSTWKRRLSVEAHGGLWSRLNDELVKRKSEIKYSPNCGLWHVAVMAVDKLFPQGVPHEGERSFAELLIAVQTFCRDPFMLDRVSVWQVADVLRVFSHRGLYDATAYRAMSEVLVNHITEFKEFRKISAMLNIFADVGHKLDASALQAFAKRMNPVGISGDVAGEALWALAVQRRLHQTVSPEFAALETKLQEIAAQCSGSRRKLRQVRRIYFGASDADEISDVHAITEVFVDDKGREQRRIRTHQAGLAVLAE